MNTLSEIPLEELLVEVRRRESKALEERARASADLNRIFLARAEAALPEMRNLKRDTARVVEYISLASGIPEEEIRGRSREHRTATARMVAMTQLHNMGHKDSAIGKVFGIDHAAVMHAVKVITKAAAMEG